MRFLLTLSLLFWLAATSAESVRILVQRSPLAGSQYYALGEFWLMLKEGDRLDLIREPDNPHDKNAIRVEWQGHKLGYIPRAENRSVAMAMDQGERLVARIARLTEHPNPWRRVEFEVYAEL